MISVVVAYVNTKIHPIRKNKRREQTDDGNKNINRQWLL